MRKQAKAEMCGDSRRNSGDIQTLQMLSKLTFPLGRAIFRNLRGFASPSTPASLQSAAEWRAALRFLCLSDLAYTTPESASSIDAESDAIEHVEKLCSEKYKAFGVEAPSKAYFYSAAKTGKRGQDAQYYTLVFRDSIVCAYRMLCCPPSHPRHLFSAVRYSCDPRDGLHARRESRRKYRPIMAL